MELSTKKKSRVGKYVRKYRAIGESRPRPRAFAGKSVVSGRCRRRRSPESSTAGKKPPNPASDQADRRARSTDPTEDPLRSSDPQDLQSSPAAAVLSCGSFTGETATESAARPCRKPTPEEIDAFFSAAEKKEQLRFMEKYNYDVAKDAPLEGRYEWVRL